MIRTHLGILPKNSRDSYIHKRLDTTGELVYGLFRDFYNIFRRKIIKSLEYNYVVGNWAERDSENITEMVREKDLSSIFDKSIISSRFKASLKGNWAMENDPDKSGIVQELNRVSYIGYQSHVKRLNTPLARDVKLAEPRRLHTTQWGVTCPIFSPDGASIGLDKHLSITTHVTIDIPSSAIRECLLDLGCIVLDDATLDELKNDTTIFVNNTIFALHVDPKKLVYYLRLYKRNGIISCFTGIYWDYLNNEIYIFTDSGRLIRPLIIVENNKSKYVNQVTSWNNLFCGLNSDRDLYDPTYKKGEYNIQELEKYQSPLEFIDVEEANNCMIAMNTEELEINTLNKYTHCEIHPSTTLSLYTNTIPFANHNPAPRNVFSGAQGKQAIGIYATNFNNRMDTMSYILHYPQKPLVTTKYNSLTYNDNLPYGENLIVAIVSHSGYNQEDAVIMNRSSIERGMFNLTYYKSFVDTESQDKLRGKSTILCNPYELSKRIPDLKCKYANELTIDQNGMPRNNAYIDEGDMMLGKVSIETNIINSNKTKKVTIKDSSKIADKTIEGTIDKHLVFRNEKDERNVKIRMRKYRAPVLGDKVASRHSQKGVIGMIIDATDMPFTSNGLVPDIMINPHALPSRMTVGHILEALCAKSSVFGCHLSDATVFEKHDFDFHRKVLSDMGFEKHGNEIMYNGKNGIQIQSDIFIAPTYYMRLKHMASDKINYRSTGPVSTVSRQPVRGRAIDGGLRIGEMERDSLLANGMTSFLKECFIEKSDGMLMYMKDQNINVPYSWKLLTQEIFALGIGMQFVSNIEHTEYDEETFLHLQNHDEEE
jgi:DNA-directed RNA polymerase II subunit RPB2